MFPSPYLFLFFDFSETHRTMYASAQGAANRGEKKGKRSKRKTAQCSMAEWQNRTDTPQHSTVRALCLTALPFLFPPNGATNSTRCEARSVEEEPHLNLTSSIPLRCSFPSLTKQMGVLSPPAPGFHSPDEVANLCGSLCIFSPVQRGLPSLLFC
ncbi:hypothetical protein PVIIG_04911 [Plasmodium vivax India VII]|uniref:Uncharacterized protein n=4 Tax=Plasmodium vivax TaxID=5855 RepID=A5KBK4_PLAVS|nr:hypothetical protein PVX_003710 [Plasmodium vivax]EDL43254.1 hypothetical protein PVX_003710 [Plasmodium vivax]KMZ82169.1 hypothetical protein PVIIG_04911 [Plasmodium vivax India VII]KMZ88267.1 hypothetical protein PVBG_05131 [Plasmodium vivax Brazil I]KMZ94833.1 hypothetical protein PVMG_02722 [Plasmodium vivax Mauritania I]|eukprot:XP_001612981.1 hypothetical protein [Plasmodium vivax Sal-1]